jgi:hypothetical protein
VLLPAQEQIDRNVISAFAVGELSELAQDSFCEAEIEAETSAHGDVLLKVDG